MPFKSKYKNKYKLFTILTLYKRSLEWLMVQSKAATLSFKSITPSSLRPATTLCKWDACFFSSKFRSYKRKKEKKKLKIFYYYFFTYMYLFYLITCLTP